MLKDSEGKALTSQQITSMSFASTKPPKFDCEIFTDSNKTALLSKDDEPLSTKRSIMSNGNSGGDYSDNYIIFVSLITFFITI
jgi:hypothetical protein